MDNLLKAASRKRAEYKLDDEHTITLLEMSAKDQFEWNSLMEKLGDDLPKVYATLVKRCSPEFDKYEVEDIEKISPSHLIAMGDKIVELSQKKT
ncbi:MAG: hypothetical protein ACN2B6_00605 [Rickettsiales bacterium]